jgi:hypothetical protein
MEKTPRETDRPEGIRAHLIAIGHQLAFLAIGQDELLGDIGEKTTHRNAPALLRGWRTENRQAGHPLPQNRRTTAVGGQSAVGDGHNSARHHLDYTGPKTLKTCGKPKGS